MWTSSTPCCAKLVPARVRVAQKTSVQRLRQHGKLSAKPVLDRVRVITVLQLHADLNFLQAGYELLQEGI